MFEAGLLLLNNVSAIHQLKDGNGRVLRVTIVLRTFAETKVRRVEG